MKIWKESKGFYILLSVCIATLLWMFVRQSVDPAQDGTIRNIPVVLSGEHVLEDQGMTVKSISAETVTLTVFSFSSNSEASITAEILFATASSFAGAVF